MIRPKSSARHTYKPARQVRPEPIAHVHVANVVAETCCNKCGWPTGSRALRDGWDGEGNYLYRHNVCPTSRERAELRRASLIQMVLV